MLTSRRPIFLNNGAQPCADFTLDTASTGAFHQSLPDYKETPLPSLQQLAKELRVKAILIKDESARFGLPSFKILGASWGVYRALTSKLGLAVNTSMEELARAVKNDLHKPKLFAATDGNHGRAVAFMGRLLSVEVDIFVPRSLDQQTKDAISAEGARIFVSGDYDDAVSDAAATAESVSGGVLIQDTSFPGYETIPAYIVDGYSTMLREIDNQLEKMDLSVDLVICPVGVGSLAHAVTRYFKARRCSAVAKVATVEPDKAASLYTSLQAGKIVPILTTPTIMTGLNCGTTSFSAWPCLKTLVDVSLCVSDSESHLAVQDLSTYGVAAGPCGAAGLAALRILALEYREEVGINEQTVVVLLNTEGKRSYVVPQ